MTICIIGLPGGVDPRHEQLKELVSSKVVDYYEIFGAREVVLYWRSLAPKEVKSFKVDMVASIPGAGLMLYQADSLQVLTLVLHQGPICTTQMNTKCGMREFTSQLCQRIEGLLDISM